jgi:hypothetical protein
MIRRASFELDKTPSYLMSILTTRTFASPQARLATKFFDAYTTHNMKAVAGCLSEDFVHTLLPRSLGRPSRNKQEWLTFMTPFTVMIPDLKVCYY